MTERSKSLFIFDVDGTLCESQTHLEEPMFRALRQLGAVHDIAIVSGSNCEKVLSEFNVKKLKDLRKCGLRYAMFENGVMSYELLPKEVKLLHKDSMLGWLGPEKFDVLVNKILKLLESVDYPVKRDGVLESRNGNLNVCPVGRKCTYEERLAFNAWDREAGCRKKLCADLNAAFESWGLVCRLGGQISVDVGPKHWTKAMVLPILERHKKVYEDIVFFGDNCGPAGNDEPLYSSVRNHHWVRSPEHCYELLIQEGSARGVDFSAELPVFSDGPEDE